MPRVDDTENERTIDLRIEGDEGEFRGSIERLAQALIELRDNAVDSRSALEFLGEAGIETLGSALKGSAEGLAAAFESLGRTGEISLKTLGNAVRNAVAQQIKEIGALAFVRSIFELAAGFATLFLNPAESGAHFQAAALFAAIGVAASALGGAISGGAGPSGTGASAGTGASEVPIEGGETPRGGLRIEIINNGTMTENVGEIIVNALKDAIDNDRIILESPAGSVSAS